MIPKVIYYCWFGPNPLAVLNRHIIHSKFLEP